ncbi:MAG: hypothetical protein ACYCW6_13670 [Candidatus Xenobia bacterium]
MEFDAVDCVRQYALKTFYQVDDPDYMERFTREILIGTSIHHPIVCTMVDWGVEQGQPFLVMELFEGEEVRRRINAEAPLDLNSRST